MKYLVNLFLGLALLVTMGEALKILCLYSAPFYSHQMVQRTLTEELARQGHQLVVLTPVPRQTPVANITEIDVKEKSFALWEEGYEKSSKNRATYAIPDAASFWNMVSETMVPIHNTFFEHPQFRALIEDKTKQFDLILLEATSYKLAALRSRFKAPIVLVSTLSVSSAIFNMVGAETNIFLYPDVNTETAWNLSLWEKIRCLYKALKFKLSQRELKRIAEEDIKIKFGQQTLVSREFKEGVSMLFLNMHRFWDNNRPAPVGTVVYIEGAHLKTREVLPQNLRLFMEQSQRGVIIVSLGSKLNSSTLPARTLKAMIGAFAQLPFDVVWKWDQTVMPNKPKNIRLEKWLPQHDLLHHPNVKAFVTHGGMQSTEEAIDAAVPMIGLPVFLDQWLNTHQYEKHGIGIRLDIDTLSMEEFTNAILAVVTDKKYRENAQRLSRAMADLRERGGLGAAARAARRLAAHGSAHLRAPLADASLVDHYMIDLILTTLIVGFLSCFCVVFVAKRIIKTLFKYF